MRIGLDARLAGAGLGVSRLIQALGAGLPRRGIELVWIGEARIAPTGVAEVLAPPGPGFAGLDSPLGHRLARARGIELMHFAANAGWWRAGREPAVLTVHDLIWSRSGGPDRSARQRAGHAYLRFAVPRAIRAAATVVAPSAVAAAELHARHGVRARQIPNAVAEHWRTARPAPAGGAPYLVAFSGRDERKATDIVLDAWERLDGVGLKLLAGAGIPPRLTGRVDALSAAGRIEVVPYLEDRALAATVAGAVALLYPSRDEGFGLPVAEAMAAGTPVITGLAPVTREVGGEAVLRLDPADPVASAAAHVRRLQGDPSLRQELSERGRARAEPLRWDAVLDAYRDLYAEVLSAPNRALAR